MNRTHRIYNIISLATCALFLLASQNAEARRRTPTAKPAAAATVESRSGLEGEEEQQGEAKDPAARAESARADEEAAAEVAEKKAKTSVGVPLSQRIKAVTSQSFIHKKRFLIGPVIGTTINDPFYASLALGLNAGFYVTEHLLIGLSGEFLPVNGPTNLVKVVGRAEGKEAAHYYAPMYFAYVDVNWVPFYGKMSIMAEGVLHYDFYLVGGLGIAGMRSTDENVDYPPLSMSGKLGIGAHLFVNKWIGIRVELTDRISYGARYIGDVPGKEEASIQNIIGLTVGADFLFPRSW